MSDDPIVKTGADFEKFQREDPTQRLILVEKEMRTLEEQLGKLLTADITNRETHTKIENTLAELKALVCEAKTSLHEHIADEDTDVKRLEQAMEKMDRLLSDTRSDVAQMRTILLAIQAQGTLIHNLVEGLKK